MGMLDDGTSYDPADPSQVGQPYKVPAASMLDQLGIPSPTQRAQMAFQNQQSMISRQLQQQQMMLQMRQEQNNMGIGRAQLATGFGYPTLLAEQATGPNSMLHQSIQQMTGPTGILNGGGQQGQQPGMGMQGMTPPPANQVDPSKIMSQEILKAQNAGQPMSAGLKSAANILGQLGQATGDTTTQQISIKAFQMAQEQEQKEQSVSATNTEKTASANKTNLDAQIEKAKAGNPGAPHDINLPTGETATTRDLFNPDGSYKGSQVSNVGQHAQYTMGELPGDSSKAVAEYGDQVTGAVGFHRAVGAVIDNMAAGGKQGWAAEMAGKVNNVLGTLRQLSPESIPDQVKPMIAEHQGDFTDMFHKTGIQESYLADMTMKLAKSYSSGGQVRAYDVNRAVKTLQEDSGDPGTFAAVLRSVDGRLGQDLSDKRDSLRNQLPAKAMESVDANYKMYKDRLSGKPGGGSMTYDPTTGMIK